MILPVYPYAALGECSLIQPVTISETKVRGLGGRAYIGLMRASLSIQLDSAAKAAAWNTFYKTTLVHGTSPFVLYLRKPAGLTFVGMRITPNTLEQVYDEGIWKISLKLQELPLEVACTGAAGLGVYSHSLAGNMLTLYTMPLEGGDLTGVTSCVGTPVTPNAIKNGIFYIPPGA